MTLFPLIAAAAIAGLPVSDPVEAQPRAGSSQQGISNLMTAALAAMRDEADAVGADRRADSVDRRSAQTQYARAVRRVRGCDAVVAEIAARPEIMGQGIEMIAMDAIRDGDRACATRLAPIIIERAADPGYEPAGQIGLRFRAGAILDGAGQPEGKAIMREAEAELQSRADRYAIWESRFDAIEAYPAGTAGHRSYLERLANQLAAEGAGVPSSTRNGILALYGLYDRCDLVARAVGPDPKACVTAKADAKVMYVDPPAAAMIESARTWERFFGLEAPRLDAEGLAEARRVPQAWRRISRLLAFISACRKQLAEAGGAGALKRP